ncbi:MAG TPA: hypothetical protein VJ844_04045 [Mucilaginibacter sp.]|nr:hypothetical protein [Mucilaginibacter sp.]
MIIYAIKIEDKKISSILNFIKYLCAPNSKTEVHLSIRGPYKSKLENNKVDELNRIIKDSLIKVNEIGNFFMYGQNTVYLKCLGSTIVKVWKKTHYGYNPHLTLYDGADSNFAHALFEMLNILRINFTFKSSGLILYDTDKLYASTLLKLGINNEIMQETLGIDWRSIDPNKCTNQEKLELIKRCFLII